MTAPSNKTVNWNFIFSFNKIFEIFNIQIATDSKSKKISIIYSEIGL